MGVPDFLGCKISCDTGLKGAFIRDFIKAFTVSSVVHGYKWQSPSNLAQGLFERCG